MINDEYKIVKKYFKNATMVECLDSGDLVDITKEGVFSYSSLGNYYFSPTDDPSKSYKLYNGEFAEILY